jgi:hypothetical protein
MIVRNLDVPRRAIPPYEAEPPLIVDADTVLALTVAAQTLQTVARRHAQIFDLPRGIDSQKLRAGGALAASPPQKNIGTPPHPKEFHRTVVAGVPAQSLDCFRCGRSALTAVGDGDPASNSVQLVAAPVTVRG